MKIKEYDTNELLMIANNVTGEYSDKQVRQAKEEQKLYFTYKNIHPISTIPSNPQLSSSASFLRLNVLSSLN